MGGETERDQPCLIRLSSVSAALLGDYLATGDE
jgi:hypothetical protein